MSPALTKRKRRNLLINLTGLVALSIAAFPVVWVVLTAFRPNSEINSTPPVWIPERLTLDGFAGLFGLLPEYAAGIPVLQYGANSLRAALFATVFSVAIGTIAGYAFSRFDFKGSRIIFLLLLLTRAVPGIALSIPLFLLLRSVNLVDTISGLVLVYTAVNIPFTAWLMDGFFRRIPKELDEAAYVDGAGHWKAFWRVDLPLALPGLGAAAIFAFLASWNEYQLASLITKTPASKTFPVGLFDLTSQFTVDWRGMAAMSVIMMVPAILFVALTQRSLTTGLTFGAVKS